MSKQAQTLSLQQALDLALQHHTAGRLSDAETIYQQILQTDPDQPIALHLLGVIAHQVGKNDKAVDLITKALAIIPDVADAHNNLGLAFQELGKLHDALTNYRKALAIRPDFAEAFYNQGNTLRKLGRLEEAATSYGKALAIKPDYAKVHNNLGNTLRDLNKLDQAMASYRKALNTHPNYAEAHSNLGLVLQDIGKPEDAVTSFQKALAIKPTYVDATINLGRILQELDRPTEAFTYYRRAISLNPQNDLAWSIFAGSLESISFFASVDDGLYQDLLQLLERATVGPSYIAKPIINALHHDPDFRLVVEALGPNKPSIETTYSDIADKLSTIPLFLRILELSPISDLETERMLTVLRRGMILKTTGRNAKEQVTEFSVALALNCFTNDYVFPETEKEKDTVEHLQRQVSALVEREEAVPASIVVALGSYRPLFGFPWAQKLTEQEWTDDIKRVIKRQITEPMEEHCLRDRIPCITLIQNAISQSVREQYEENPYPRWTKTDIHYESRTIANVLKAPPLQFDLGDYNSPEKPKILIAGCGTGRHALYTASRYLNAQVLAMDLSLSSLSYAKRKTDELGFSNIKYVQGDITELDLLGQQFDLIECVGVLHHLGDPLSGWRTLVNLLPPTGLMNIGLYSKLARQDIVRARSVIAKKGYTASPKDIRKCRQDIIAMAENGDRAMAKICNERLFFGTSECRDFLFHVQEHQFTLTQIEEALQSMNLTFLGFEMRDQSTLKKFRDLHPNNDALTSLPLWHKFELEHPNTFRGMYQFWCQKL